MDIYHRKYADHNEIELTFFNDPDDLSALDGIMDHFRGQAQVALMDGDPFRARDLLQYECNIQELMDAMKEIEDERKGEGDGQE